MDGHGYRSFSRVQCPCQCTTGAEVFLIDERNGHEIQDRGVNAGPGMWVDTSSGVALPITLSLG